MCSAVEGVVCAGFACGLSGEARLCRGYVEAAESKTPGLGRGSVLLVEEGA
jgi:hypothetical protein